MKKYLLMILSALQLSLFADMSVATQSNDLIVKIDTDKQTAAHMQLFINADNSTSTGYSKGIVKGADYLIEDRVLFKREGNTNRWRGWRRVASVRLNRRSKGYTVTIDSSQIDLKDGAKFVAYGIDSRWRKHLLLAKSRYSKPVYTGEQRAIYLIGDSIVHTGATKKVGWGDRLNLYTKDPGIVHNLARPGASSKSYDNAQRYPYRNWQKTRRELLESSHRGDYLFIEFGHNDARRAAHVHTEPGRYGEFYENLKSYVDQARDMELIPVLITPMELIHKGKWISFAPHVNTVRALARDEHVLLLDLNKKSYREFNKYSSNHEVRRVFSVDENVHLNPNGAKIVAGWVKELACQADQKLCVLFK